MKPTDDLYMARSYLCEHEDVKVVAVKGQSMLGVERGMGIQPLVDLIDRLGDQLEGASVADRVIGEAASVLLIQSRVKAVHGDIMSEAARKRLQNEAIQITYDHGAPQILARDQKNQCIMEQEVTGVDDVDEAVKRLRRRIASLG